MRSVERRVCAEENVVVAFRVQHSFQAALGRAGDGARGEAVVLVGIVGRVYGEVRLEDAPGLVVKAERYGRIGLQFHAGAKPVKVHAGDGGLLGDVAGFPVYDGSER